MSRNRTNSFRHRKHIPYGSKGYCGCGGEFYSKKHGGLYITDIVDKNENERKIK